MELKAAKDIISLVETLTHEQKHDFVLTLEQLIRETSEAPLSKIKFKRYIKKIENDLAQSIKELLIDIVPDSIKKSIIES